MEMLWNWANHGGLVRNDPFMPLCVNQSHIWYNKLIKIQDVLLTTEEDYYWLGLTHSIVPADHQIDAGTYGIADVQAGS